MQALDGPRRAGVRAGVAGLSMLAVVAAASGQLVPPTPAKTPPTEPYTPPAAAPAAPTPPSRPEPEVDAPLPTLVKKGPDGKVVRLDVHVEQAAVEAMTFDEATRKRIDAGLADYRSDMDRRVIENPALIVQLIHQRDAINNHSSLEELQKMTQGIGALRPGSLLERLQRSGAINPRQKRRAEQVVQEYTRAVTAEVNAEAGNGNFDQIVALGGRRIFLEMSGEAVRSLDRQLAKAEPTMELIVSGLSLSTVQKNQAAMLLGPAGREGIPEDRRKHIRRTNLRALFIDVLNDEQRTSLLKATSPELVMPKAEAPKTEPPKGGG